MSSCVDITRAVRPPRAAFLDFPLGHTTGKPRDAALQRAIVLSALEALVSTAVPGTVTPLPYRWDDEEAWKQQAMRGGDLRVERYETPQYQTEEDRRRAEGAVESTCGACRSPE